MSVTQTRNVDYVLVGKDVAATAAASLTSPDDLANGQVGIFNVYGTGANAALSAGSFVIAIGGANGKPAFVSEAIDPAKVSVAKTRGQEDATEQSDSLGYNGATGAIATLTANQLYKVDFYIQEYLTSNTDGRYIKHAVFQAGTTAPTEIEVAEGIGNSAILNFSKEAEDYIQVDVHSAAAPTALTGTGTLTIANGSKYLTAGTDIDAVLVVGGYVRLDESVGGATAVTDSVYRVVAMDTTNEIATLDRPYTGTSMSAAAVGNGSYIAKATADAAAAGVTFTGKPLSFVVGKKQYKKVRWELMAGSEFGTSPVREANAFEGIGEYELAAEAEWFARGFEGEYHRMGEPGIYPFSGNATNLAADGATELVYDVTTIRWVHDDATGLQAGDVSPKQITIYSPANGTAATGAADYMTSSYGTAQGAWEQIEAAMASYTAKMSNRDTGANADTSGSLEI